MSKLDEMWAALEAHKPKRGYAKAWRGMCKERTEEAIRAAYYAAPEGSAAKEAALSALVAADAAAVAARVAREADQAAQDAIDAIKEVKP